MPVNEEHIEARIREINDSVRLLSRLTAKGSDELTVDERLSMRYLLIELVEAASSICMQILLGFFNEKAEGFPECFDRLGAKGIIPEDLASRLGSAARLRNLLVHRYWEIDDSRVHESVRNGLKDFETFTTHVREFFERSERR